MSSESTRIESNIRVISLLREGSHIGCDSQGMLYVEDASARSGKVSQFFHGFQEKSKASHVIALATEKYFENLDPKDFSQRYRVVLEIFKQDNCLLPDDKRKLIERAYQYKYEGLIKKGIESTTAQAICCIEMSFDPEVDLGVRNQISPKLTAQGINGSYFIKNFQGQIIGIFKPSDEEAYMPNNPRGKTDTSFTQRVGHFPGTSCYKEVLAYDLGGELLGVPYTTTITVTFPENPTSTTLVQKTGSFQLFVQGTALDSMTTREVDIISTKQIQMQAAFDLVFGNGDRHYGNTLYNKSSDQLHLIDHGLILLGSLSWYNEPDKIISEIHGDWISCKQVKEPVLQEVKNWIASLDENEVERKIRDRMSTAIENFSENQDEFQKHVDGIIIATKTQIRFVKKAVENGYSLYEIGEMMMETLDNYSSRPAFEEICADTSKFIRKSQDLVDPWQHLSSLFDSSVKKK